MSSSFLLLIFLRWAVSTEPSFRDAETASMCEYVTMYTACMAIAVVYLCTQVSMYPHMCGILKLCASVLCMHDSEEYFMCSHVVRAHPVWGAAQHHLQARVAPQTHLLLWLVFGSRTLCVSNWWSK